MSAESCPTCATPYTPGEIVGLGILRARPAREGGPRVEYRCAGCGEVLTFVPYGDGRYAPPGEAPPEAVPEPERRPPWVRSNPTKRAGSPPPPPAPPGTSPRADPAATTRPGPGGAAPDADFAPPTLLEAYELLGVSVSAGRAEVERAFRNRSLTCHPDKVAHLDDDFRVLAERKFKRLLEAFRLLDDLLAP